MGLRVFQVLGLKNRQARGLGRFFEGIEFRPPVRRTKNPHHLKPFGQ
jgi:hypothetical protein